jgi:hypothetical protein
LARTGRTLRPQGSAEVWFESIEAARRGLATPEWQAVLDDSKTLWISSRCPRIADEHPDLLTL